MSKHCDRVEISGADLSGADLNRPAQDADGKPYVIIRSYGAGVFAGYLKDTEDTLGGRIATVDECIRMHAWTGCSLSQVANDGIAGDGVNRFSMPTQDHKIMQVIEIIPATERARKAIQGVPTWKI